MQALCSNLSCELYATLFYYVRKYFKRCSTTQKLIAIFGLAFVIRVIWAITVRNVPISDCTWFIDVAQSLATTHDFAIDGVPTAYRPPAYGAFLGVLFMIFGKNILMAKLFGAVLGSFAVVILAFWAKKFTDHWELYGITCAFFPEHIFYTNILSSEILFQMLLALWLLAVSRQKYVGAGALAGLMTLARGAYLPLALLPLFWDARLWKRILFGAVIGVIVCVPWVWRNECVLGERVLATNFWVNLWIGNGEFASGRYFDPPFAFTGEIEAENFYHQELTANISQTVLTFAKVAPAKFFWFAVPVLTPAWWGLHGVAPKKNIIAFSALFSLLNVLVVIWFALVAVRRKMSAHLLWCVLFFCATVLAFFGDDRYKFPLMLPMLLSFFVVTPRSVFLQKH